MTLATFADRNLSLNSKSGFNSSTNGTKPKDLLTQNFPNQPANRLEVIKSSKNEYPRSDILNV